MDHQPVQCGIQVAGLSKAANFIFAGPMICLPIGITPPPHACTKRMVIVTMPRLSTYAGNNTISDSRPATPYPYCQLQLTTRGAYHCPSIVPSPQPVKGLNNDTDQTCLSTADVVGLPAQSSPPNSTAMIADS